jgi:hypothetical protein
MRGGVAFSLLDLRLGRGSGMTFRAGGKFPAAVSFRNNYRTRRRRRVRVQSKQLSNLPCLRLARSAGNRLRGLRRVRLLRW